MYVKLEDFKAKLANKTSVIGPFMKTSDPAFVETSGYAGFDFVILDMEHGPNSYERMQDLIRAAEIGGVAPIIRVADYGETTISKALDIGAFGIQVPQISTAEQALKVIDAAKGVIEVKTKINIEI